jgi:hypothetical protein
MTDNDQETGRGAQEEASGVPLTPTEVEANRRPPSQPDDTATVDAGDGAGMAGGSSGGSGGGSGLPGHPDAAD